MTYPRAASYETRQWFYRRVRLARYVAAYLRARDKCDGGDSIQHEKWNVAATRAFFAWAASRTRLCVYLFPGSGCYDAPYHEGTGVPVMRLRADGFPPEYKEVHPPEYVLTWYGVEIAKWLRSNGLVSN